MLSAASSAPWVFRWGWGEALPGPARCCYVPAVHKAFRFRLYPTSEQEQQLAETAGTVRFVYNLALEQRRDFWRQFKRVTGSVLNFASQGREVTALRREFDWIQAAPSNALTQALRDLDKAFSAYFKGNAGFPQFRRRGVNESFRVQSNQCAVRPLNTKWSAVRLPNIGWVKFRLTRHITGTQQSITVSRDALGWHVSFACCNVPPAVTSDRAPIVAIDRGIVRSLTLSTGEVFNLPQSVSALELLSRHKRRSASKKRRGSNRARAARKQIARVLARIARIRSDWRHRVSTHLASRFEAVAVEDLKVRNMTASATGNGRSAKAGLNREIRAQGWSAFETTLAYKLEERGGTLIKVHPAYSSQECSACGVVDKRSRKSQAAFSCVHCGFALNADHNAALNLLRRSTALMGVEGPGCRPAETSTGGRLRPVENLAA